MFYQRKRDSCFVMFMGLLSGRSSGYLVLALLALVIPAQEVSAADTRCPGGCTVSVVFLDQPATEVTFDVDLQIGEFETISATIRRAPVRFNKLTSDDFGGIRLQTGSSPPSFFYLESQSPTGEPFFPADSHADYFFVMDVEEVSLLLRNESAMVVEAQGLEQFPPPAPFSYTLQAPTDFTDDMGNTVTIQSGTVTIIKDVSVAPIPTVSEWTVIGMTLLLLTAGTIVFFRRRGREAVVA